MKSKVLLALFVGIVCLFSSCITTRDTNFMQDIPKDYIQVVPSEYRVIVGDQLWVSVYSLDKEQLKESLGHFAEGAILYVRADGTIKIPHVGDMYVSDMTMYEIESLLNSRLHALFEGVTATARLNNMYFSILGDMGTERIKMGKMTMTVYEALAISGASTMAGDRKSVSIVRQTKDGAIQKTFDLRSKDIVNSEFYFIQPNDVIYVPKSKRDFIGASTTLGETIGLLTGLVSLVVFIIKVF